MRIIVFIFCSLIFSSVSASESGTKSVLGVVQSFDEKNVVLKIDERKTILPRSIFPSKILEKDKYQIIFKNKEWIKAEAIPNKKKKDSEKQSR